MEEYTATRKNVGYVVKDTCSVAGSYEVWNTLLTFNRILHA